MNRSEKSEFLNRWSERVRKTRKQFFFEWLLVGHGKKSLRELGNRILQDTLYIYESLYHILKHFKHYSSVVKDQYQISYLRQLYQVSYLAFKLRQHPKNYRKYHLFKPDVWKHANQFTYSHYKIQQIVAKKLYPDELDILLNKLNFYQFCKANKISSPEVLGYYFDGDLVSVDGDFKIPDQDIFVKEIAGQMGLGAKRYNYKNGRFKDTYGNDYSKESVVNFLKDYSTRNNSLIIQAVIRNHDTWLPFTSGALATCRVVTAKNPDTNIVELLFASLRMPVGNTDVDNYSRGGMVSAIDAETGILGKAFCSLPIAGKFERDTHPDTGQIITGFELPGWSEMKQFILTLHANLRSPFIGWDVALTKDGCMVVEGSLYWNPGASYEVAHHLPFSKSKYPVYFENWMGEKVDKSIDYSDLNI